MVSQTIGSRRQVWNGTAKKTPGGLHKSDLKMNKHGRIVSKKKSASATKEKRLLKYGYGTEKGKFGFVKIGSKSSTRKRGRRGKSKKMRGGYSLTDAAGANDSYMLTGGRSRSRGMAGGSGYGIQLDSPGSANWNGDNLVGGRRRRKMRGGTHNRYHLNPAGVNDPLTRALGAS